MNLLHIALWFAVLFSASGQAQTPVDVEFQTNPVRVQTGTDILFTVITVADVFTMTWTYQGGVTLGLWVNGAASVKPVPQFQGRVSITSTTLRIGVAQLGDIGQYTVEVDPGVSTLLGKNSKSVTLNVYDAVTGVNLFVPPTTIEGRNLSLTCTKLTGTQITYVWTKAGAALASDSRITISDGSLVINPAQRGDAGDYTCTVSNPVSARSATQTLTVYYGPDTPVLTKDTAKDCVGVGDVLAGKTITLTCTSASLPAALFSWQVDGQPISTADTGVLNLQTSSTGQSGRYTCTVKNAATTLRSEQGTDVVVVDVCLDVGEIVGIVIGSFILLILLIILIIVIVRYMLVRTMQNNSNLQPMPAPQTNVERDLGPQPPLHQTNVEPPRHGHFYTAPIPERNGTGQTPAQDTPHTATVNQHNGLTNGLQHNAIQNLNTSAPHNAFDNPAFTHNEVQNAQQNPNIIIQTGSAQVSLNTLPRTARQNNNGQIPTIHVNVNSLSDQQTAAEHSSAPIASATVDEATQTPQNSRRTSVLRSALLDRYRTTLQHDPGQIPTGYTHYTQSNVGQGPTAHADSQTYQEESERRDRSTSGSSQPASRRQLPRDTLRGTPAYPSDHQRRDTPSTARRDDMLRGTPAYPSANQRPTPSDSTDYTTYPPILQTGSRSRERERAHRADSRGRRTEQPQRNSPRNDRGRQSGAPRQDVRHDNSPAAVPLMSQASPGARSLVQQQTDIRAMADPNHLQQAQASPHTRQVPQANQMTNQIPQANQMTNQIPQANQMTNQIQQTHQMTNQIPQENHVPQMQPNQPAWRAQQENTAQTGQINQLTMDALQAHTVNSQTFRNRRQQTQAALLHPGPQNQRAPTPPPVIPLQQFQSLPTERRRQREARPPVNIPVTQRPHQRHHETHHQTHHHPPGHVHQTHHHPPGQVLRPHTWQLQAHRGRPR